MVKYQVQYKPINPATNSCATNTTLSKWDGTVSSGGTNNPNYDMLLMFRKTDSLGDVTKSDFVRVEQETWAVYAVKESVEAAMKIAKPLMEKYGVDNVQICKIVSANVEIVFEDK